MSSEFLMPSLGPDMESGTLVPGDAVKRGDVVALVETDKGVIDVEIFAAGTVDSLLVEPGAHVPVGSVLARLRDGEASTAVSVQSATAPAQAASAPSPQSAAPPRESVHAAHKRASPAARARARALGVDVSEVQGSGPGGVVTLEDVVKRGATVQSAAPVAPAHDMRSVIARAMSRSKREIPHYYLALTCSFASARAWLEEHNATAPIELRLLPSALLLKATALAARALPDFNGFYRDEEFVRSPNVHVGMAIAMRGGRLAAPAILDADRKTVAVVMRELRDLATRVRAGRMRGSELALPTITVTSLAEEGVDLVVPAIYPPQVAIVGFGAIVERPWVVEGAVRPTPVLTISLAADHRVTDGRSGARFLALIGNSLQAPQTL
jgi:pyruvate dehydrogenase E2 component (dihydrolipoamide acetyltransferase)